MRNPTLPANAASHSLLQRLRGIALRLTPFGCEIAFVLLLKILLLWLLWWAFFSAPAARHMRLDATAVQQRLLQSSPATETPHAQR